MSSVEAPEKVRKKAVATKRDPVGMCAHRHSSRIAFLAVPGSAFCLLLAMASSAFASRPAFLLEHKFTPGMELRYEFSNVLKQETSTSAQDLSFEIRMDGSNRQIVADVAGTNGVALIGQLAHARIERREGLAAACAATNGQTWIAAWRVDRRGRPIRRQAGAGNAPQTFLQRTMGQIGEGAPPCAAFPLEAVKVGSRWKGTVLLPLPDMRVPADAVSTLVGVRKKDNTVLCVISTQVRVDSTQAHADWLPDGSLPDMAVRGTSVGVFDPERGIWRLIEWNLQGTFGGADFEGRMEVGSTLTLKSATVLASIEAGEWCGRVRAFDRGLQTLYESGGQKAGAVLEAQEKAEANPDWQTGLGATLALMYMMDPLHLGTAATPPGEERENSPQVQRLRDADYAAQAEDWQEALDKYTRLAEEYPDDPLAPQALSAAASVCEARINRRTDAAEFRRKVIAIREREAAAPTNALPIYRLASAYMDADDPGRAIITYRRFLDSGTNGIPAWVPVLARYRMARLLEKTGQHQEALAAYRAVAATESPGDYPSRVAAEAERKAQRIAAEDRRRD